MRRRWIAAGKSVSVQAFLKVFMLQAAISLLINATCLKVSLNEDKTYAGITTLDVIGAIIFGIGFLMEAISDHQLQSFRDNPKRAPGSVITDGLWKYSRHPNYFGEALLWWGLYLITCSIPKGWIFFFSPLIISLLLRYVSGVPLLEKHFAKNPQFQDYAKRTSIFFPWFPKNK